MYKGYDKVIETLPEVIKEIPNIKYLMVGKGDSEETERINTLINELRLEDYVYMLGYVPNDQLVHYYLLCDLFILPSKGEGFGIVFLEALICGKPVIAGNKDGSSDTLLNGKLGLLIDPDDHSEIEQAILNIFDKKVNPDILDPEYLIRTVRENYGYSIYKNRLKQLINLRN